MNTRTTYFLAAFWLTLVSLQAPFVHFHPDDPDHQHSTGPAHLHLGHVEDSDHDHALAFDHGDEQESTVYSEWTPTATARVEILYTATTVAHSWQPTFIPNGRAPEVATSSHDPPDLRTASARAPPL